MFKTARFERRDDHLLIEAPNGLGDRERRLLDHYRRLYPGMIVLMIRSHAPEPKDADLPPHVWGDDTW